MNQIIEGQAPVVRQLTEVQRRKLETQEARIAAGLRGFVEVVDAFAVIIGEELWIEHGSPTAYARARFPELGGDRQLQRLFAAAEVVGDIRAADRSLPLPPNEAVARALGPVPREQRADAWGQAIEQAGGKLPTAAQVSAVVAPAAPVMVASGDQVLIDSLEALGWKYVKTEGRRHYIKDPSGYVRIKVNEGLRELLDEAQADAARAARPDHLRRALADAQVELPTLGWATRFAVGGYQLVGVDLIQDALRYIVIDPHKNRHQLSRFECEVWLREMERQRAAELAPITPTDPPARITFPGEIRAQLETLEALGWRYLSTDTFGYNFIAPDGQRRTREAQFLPGLIKEAQNAVERLGTRAPASAEPYVDDEPGPLPSDCAALLTRYGWRIDGEPHVYEGLTSWRLIGPGGQQLMKAAEGIRAVFDDFRAPSADEMARAERLGWFWVGAEIRHKDLLWLFDVGPSRQRRTVKANDLAGWMAQAEATPTLFEDAPAAPMAPPAAPARTDSQRAVRLGQHLTRIVAEGLARQEVLVWKALLQIIRRQTSPALGWPKDMAEIHQALAWRIVSERMSAEKESAASMTNGHTSLALARRGGEELCVELGLEYSEPEDL